MSLTISQIIVDARRLADRLRERDTVADILLNETHAVSKKIDAMKQYQEEVEQLNEVAHQKPNSQLIANIQKENRHLREIQQENRELRAALEEHQTALEHIMSKYRQHTNAQIYNTRINFKGLQEQKYFDIIKRQAEKIQEMAAVMERAAKVDEERDYKEGEVMKKLLIENKGLREMLEISCNYGSYNKPLTNTTEDKFVQTENQIS
ncbi:FGFR1 oncogene partner 2 homolog [Agrilus planipennis]|uniref:FGFR1 oncogene partner 2 homolog n=1 Tax=Agrilus planipennis TaxID=224129 RepID=A0A1W4XAU9_AGRPL|nr:FGFR1 oncogene partner 2 homolog [Agrilus planipennis]